ncbi:MAG: hypothetical protein IIC74_08305, partial [Bacteroidetes bacterium]|nr:hypothetical protein [Bacteroidota bacterium]
MGFKSGAEWNGNAKGRPVGSGGGLKDYDRKRFQAMNDKDKDEFLDKISREVRYK